MGFADLLWDSGKDNMGGIVGEIYFCPVEDIETLPALSAVGSLQTAVDDIVCKAGKKFHRIYHTAETGKVESTTVGDFDGKSKLNLLRFFYPGDDETLAEQVRLLQNTPGVYICRDSKGNLRLLGVTNFEEDSTELTLESPAYVQITTGTTGAAGGDRRGTTFEVVHKAPHRPVFYMGDLPEMVEEDVVIPTDTYQEYNLLSTFDETRYYLNSLLHQNPTNKNTVLNTFGDGVDHVTDAGKKISFRKSVNRGTTFGAKSTLYDPTDGTFQIQDPSAGYDSNGRLHILADCHTNFANAAETHQLRYMYSDDDGTTVSVPVEVPLPSNGLATFRLYGRVIEGADGVLMAPAYFFTDEGTFTNSARYCLRSADGGATWTWIEIETSSDYINETELLYVGNNVVIAVSRNEVTKHFTMYKSTDNGLTWITCGHLGTTVALTAAAPCRLHKFQLDDGTWIAAMYFILKGVNPRKIYAIYGRLGVFETSGVGGWKTTTLTELHSDAITCHYGDFCHYNGNLNARAAYPRENNAVSLKDNEIIHFEAKATHYQDIFDLLTPVTIYDALALPQIIATYRGLEVDTDNEYGIVNASGQVTTLKSIAPGPLGVDFTATAGGIVLGDGLQFDGSKVLSHNNANTWNFAQFSTAGVTDLNWTVYFVFRPGNSSNPDAAYGVFGNNGASSGGKGISCFFDDRASQSRSDAMVFYITRGSGGYIINFANQNIFNPNVDQVVCIEVDLSQANNNDKVKVWVNGVLQSTTVTTFNTNIIITPTYNMQIGACGNGALPFVGAIKDLVVQNAIDIESVRNDLMQQLMVLEGIA